MLIFGHAGITTGVFKLYEVINMKNDRSRGFIDYRIVMVGSMLPDIIDKPLVQVVYGLRNHHGHLIAHSFVFSILMMLVGIFIYRMNSNRNVFLLGICSLIHQLFDKMMLIPNVFFLPSVNSSNFVVLKRLEFIHNIMMPVYVKFPYLRDVVSYFEEPYVFISEVIGFVIVVYFIYKLSKNKRYVNFFKYGKL